MAGSRTHAIFNVNTIKKARIYIQIEEEYMKLFSFGPDTLMVTDSRTFELQHRYRVKKYFEYMLKILKQLKLLDNERAMTYTYAQVGHYVLDAICHPFIIDKTRDRGKSKIFDDHAALEMKIDDYMSYKYGITDSAYFHANSINDKKLEFLIDQLYRRVYHTRNAAFKYNMGIVLLSLFDTYGRNPSILLNSVTNSLFSIGDITHSKVEDILPYLNLEHGEWHNPVSGEVHTESFEDLLVQAEALYLETLEDINRYLYQDKALRNVLISNNVSYNTGLPCKKEEKFVFVKEYVKDHLKKRTH